MDVPWVDFVAWEATFWDFTCGIFIADDRCVEADLRDLKEVRI